MQIPARVGAFVESWAGPAVTALLFVAAGGLRWIRGEKVTNGWHRWLLASLVLLFMLAVLYFHH